MIKVQYEKLRIINNLINNGRSGIVSFSLPNAGKDNPVKGLLSDESVQLSYKNSFKSLLPNTEKLSLISQIVNTGSTGKDNPVVTWTNATQAAWIGSEPLKISLSFYLFSFDPDDNIDKDFSYFRELMHPTRYSKNNNDFFVSVHGGYKPKISGDTGYAKNVNIDNSVFTEGDGTIKVQIGSGCILRGMLLEDINEERSSVQVEKGTPLYIKATVQLRSRRLLFADEVESLFKVNL